MGGMKDEAKRVTIPPLFPRVHVNDTGRGGLSHPPFYKRSSLPSPTKKISSHSHSNLSLSLPPRATATDRSEMNASPVSKLEGKMNKETSPRGSSVSNTKPSSIKQHEYQHFKNLANPDSLKFLPLVRRSELTDPQANTDLSLQFCSSSSNKPVAKSTLNNLHVQELLSEDASQSGSLSSMRSQLYGGRTLAGFSNETQKKPKTLPPREQDVSESSAIDSLSGVSASSNDIARVIGDKRFLRMRYYMINQQKIFAAQVFELHRLIMVQKMVAKSSFVESKDSGGGKHGTIRPSHPLKRPITENQKPVTEEYPKHITPKLPLPPISKELVTPVWPLPPPGNQWLVPVMSPSEGLVYKPYAGPCPPPPSAFMVPLYGQDSLDAAFRFPSYFPPVNTRTTLDQTNPFDQFQRWSSTSSHMTQAIPFSLKKSQESNDSEVHGSTASSPPEKHKFDVLPLFPTEPTHHTAIKAVPHNAISASESAARIFRSIQEERRDLDHMIS